MISDSVREGRHRSWERYHHDQIPAFHTLSRQVNPIERKDKERHMTTYLVLSIVAICGVSRGGW